MASLVIGRCMMEQYIKIGQIVNTHGYKGEVKVYPLTDDPERFLQLEHVYLRQKDQSFVEYQVRRARLHQNMAILEFAEIADMDRAIQLKGFYLELPESELRPLPEGRYYIFQIIGLEVYEAEEHLGRIVDVIDNPANDLYLVETQQGKKIQIPAVKEIVQEIDLLSGRINVKLPLGLMD